MQLLRCRNLKKGFGPITVLEGVNLDINEGEKIGLVGENGAGKSTLARILIGELEADDGFYEKYYTHFRVGYLEQTASYSENSFSQVMTASRQDKAASYLELTSKMGLTKVQFWEEEKFSVLSGGERAKLALARVWLEKPDLLILDEPTNNLDYQGIEWLISEIANYTGAVLMISHDRYFLDKSVKKIMELDKGKIELYQGNYSCYRQEKQRKYEKELRRYQVESKEQNKLEAQINQLDGWSNKAHQEARGTAIANGMKFGGKEFYRAKAKKMDKQVKSRKKRLEKLKKEGISRPEEESKVLFELNKSKKRGRRIVEASNLAKSFGEKVLFKNSSFYIKDGEKVGLLGENGCGKTTLIKILLGQEQPLGGDIWISPSLEVAYMNQNDDLAGDKTILELLDCQKYYNDRERKILIKMGFDQSFMETPVKDLSPGERARLKIAKMVLKNNNCLILDEPTNHLDLASREQLEAVLKEYQGTVIIVSHDLYLLKKITTKLLVFNKQTVQRLEWGYQDYIKRRQRNKNGGVEGEKMCLKNKISYLLGKLGQLPKDDPEYLLLEQEYNDIVSRLREMD